MADERVMLVTGATSGIGRATAIQLAATGARVIVHGRDPRKCRETVDEIERRTGNGRCEAAVADLSSLEQVRSLAEDVVARSGRLDVLVNNAGTYHRRRHVTADGLEETFEVNHLAPFLLTLRLLDRLLSSAPARVVTVASVAHRGADLRDLGMVTGDGRYNGYAAYALSKFGNIVFTYALARRLLGTRVTANAVHPGAVNTKLLHAGFPMSFGISPERGAEEGPVHVATAPELEGVTGRYFERLSEARSAPATYDEGIQERFWELSERLSGQVYAPRAAIRD